MRYDEVGEAPRDRTWIERYGGDNPAQLSKSNPTCRGFVLRQRAGRKDGARPTTLVPPFA
jgi:hypothetical protein